MGFHLQAISLWYLHISQYPLYFNLLRNAIKKWTAILSIYQTLNEIWKITRNIQDLNMKASMELFFVVFLLLSDKLFDERKASDFKLAISLFVADIVNFAHVHCITITRSYNITFWQAKLKIKYRFTCWDRIKTQ